MTKIRELLRSNKAYSSAPLAVVIALAGMMFFVVLWQIIRLITISAGVKDAVQSAVIATSVGNYSNVYDGVREGYSGGYRYSGNPCYGKLSITGLMNRKGLCKEKIILSKIQQITAIFL